MSGMDIFAIVGGVLLVVICINILVLLYQLYVEIDKQERAQRLKDSIAELEKNERERRRWGQ